MNLIQCFYSKYPIVNSLPITGLEYLIDLIVYLLQDHQKF